MRLLHVLLQDRTDMTLELQQQMVNEHKDLEETNAGKELQAEMIKERERTQQAIAELQEQHSEALRTRDMQAAQDLAEVKQDYTTQIAELNRSLARVKISTQRLIEEKYETMMKEQQARHEEALKRVEAEKEVSEMQLAGTTMDLWRPSSSGATYAASDASSSESSTTSSIDTS
jgi:hypothetical protein